MTKVAILGGSFDPPHQGHLGIAQAALAAGVDRVVWVPAAASPFKRDRPPAPALDRWAMLALVTVAEPRFWVSRIELDRPPPSFSIDTVHALRSDIGDPEARLWWIIGADHVSELTRWHRIDELLKLVRFFVVPRQDLCGDALGAAISGLPGALQEAIDILEMPVVPTSSTQIRELLAIGTKAGDSLPDAVASYIDRYQLYRPKACSAGPDKAAGHDLEARIREYLEREIPPKRRAHIFGVARTAEELASRFGADPLKARLAGLLHDIVRLWSPERLLGACREHGLDIGPFDLKHPIVRLHGLLGAHLARDWFGVEDAEILAAIASHTLGHPQMGLLERILYVADYCEPGRGPSAQDVRDAAESNLDAALLLAMDGTISYLLLRGQAIHPQAIEARNSLLAADLGPGMQRTHFTSEKQVAD